MGDVDSIVPKVTWRDRLEDVPAPEGIEEARLRVLTNAYWCAGLRAGVPEELPVFRSMLGTPYKNAEFDLSNGYHYSVVLNKPITRGTSTCALVAGEIWRMSGVQVPWSGQPYKGGTAVSRIFDWGRSKALYVATPEPGDICLIGSGLGEHVCVFVEVDGDVVHTVDGGQIDYGNRDRYGVPLQTIQHVRRPYSQRGEKLYFGERPLQKVVGLARVFEEGLFGAGKEAVEP